jgi:predicted lactoylglutathione lyase
MSCVISWFHFNLSLQIPKLEPQIPRKDTKLNQESYMKSDFPAPVPEIPVSDINAAATYYQNNLGFTLDWSDEGLGLAGISKGHCRMFLANQPFRSGYGNTGPILTWLNLDSNEAVDDLYRVWSASNARLISAPESKPWGLHEFTAADLDGNLFRVFYDFATPEREKGQS